MKRSKGSMRMLHSISRNNCQRHSLRDVVVFTTILLTLCVAPLFASGKQESNAKTVKISFSVWDAIPEEHNFVAAFMKQNPDITVEVVKIPSDNYSQKLNTMVASDTAPDVMLLWECDLPQFANGDKLVPLDSYIAGTSAFSSESFIPAMKTIQNATGGKTFGLPWCYASELLYYNKGMFDAAGIPYPNADWTWENFTNAARKLTIKKNGITSQWGVDGINYNGIWYSLAGAGGDSVINDKGTLEIGEGARAALQMQYDLVNIYKASPAPSVSSAGSDLFLAGRAAMTRGGSWMCSTYRQISDFSWDIAPLPKGKQSYASLHTGFFAISKNSKNKDAAWRFIEFSMSKAGQELISKAYNNPSAITTFAAKGAYRIQGEKGPTNWDAFDETAQFGKFGYVLAPSGLTGDIVKKFQAAVLGQISIDQAVVDAKNLIVSGQ